MESESSIVFMKRRFYRVLDSSRRLTGAKNTVYIEDEHYRELIKEVRKAKTKSRKTTRDYWLLRRYDVSTVDQKAVLIFPVSEPTDKILHYACDSELFDILHESHIRIGHGGRDRMMKDLWSYYKNITRKDIEIYLELCVQCKQKQRRMKKGTVANPNISSEINSRWQVDLIDFQSQPDGYKKFILVCQDHLTKFVVLRPLKSKQADEVAYNLLDIFTLIGAPAILQSDNGREFTRQIIEYFKQYWPTLKIIDGKPSHSQSLSSLNSSEERKDIENMLTKWMKDNDNSHWSEGIRFVQLMKNRAHHAVIKKSPYEALFGCKAKVGLQLPKYITQNVETEEDLEYVVNGLTENEEESKNCTFDLSKVKTEPMEVSTNDSDQSEINMQLPIGCQNKCIVCSQETTWVHTCRECGHAIHAICAIAEESPDERTESTLLCPMCSKKVKALENVKSAKNNLQQKVKKVKNLTEMFTPVSIGTSVRIAVPDVDKVCGNARNIIGVVLAKTNDERYQIGTKKGVIKQLYTRSELNVCPRALLDIKDVPSLKIALRIVPKLESPGTSEESKNC